VRIFAIKTAVKIHLSIYKAWHMTKATKTQAAQNHPSSFADEN
jgi:hypothetical protein